MNRKVLLVDDDVNILDAYRRVLRGKLELSVAEGGKEALTILKRSDPFAVIVSDYRMPEMDGIEILARARELCPDTVRIMLTGQADMQAAIDAINQGNIFRFLTKPCPSEIFLKQVYAGMEQYRLIHAERELLDQTLKGSIKVLVDILALVNPMAFSRLGLIRSLAKNLAIQLGEKDIWKVELAALLSQIGCVTVPPPILQRAFRQEDLTPQETALFYSHPQIGCDLLKHIPRMEEVAEAINYQMKNFDGSGYPPSSLGGEDIPLVSRILRVAGDFEGLISTSMPEMKAIRIMQEREGIYDPVILDALKAEVIKLEQEKTPVLYAIYELQPGMILAEDILDGNGLVLITKYQEITDVLITRLKNYARMGMVQEPIKVISQRTVS
ncbi:MAG: response regulator [Syntrophomonadaceae bacterium]|nr:response regulator [Syntrophomonadaceae bacterium]